MRALLVALDLPTAGQIGAALEQAWPGAVISLAGTVEDACALMEREHVDVVLLGASAASGGLQLCEDVCSSARVPVLLVAERRGLVDSVRAAELGVDAVLWRPLTASALTNAIRSLQDASEQAPAARLSPLEADGLRIDYAARAVTVEGQPVELNATEWRLLYHLTRNANSVLAYETLLAKVWGRRRAADQDMLKVHIDRLSLKISTRQRGRSAIVRRAGFGFGFDLRAAIEG